MFEFGLGLPELVIIAIVAIIFVGPKDLPKLLRTISNFVGQIKGMAREFQGHVEDAARETGLNELKDDINKATDVSNLEEKFHPSDPFEHTPSLRPGYKADEGEGAGGGSGSKTKPKKSKSTAKKAAKKSPAKKTTAKKVAPKKPVAKKAAAKKPAKKSKAS